MGFEDDLLNDGGKWWEFMDDSYQVKEMPSANQASTELLDWSTKFKLQERHGPVGFDFHERCAQCTNPLPPDVTFCFHCGGEPVRSTGFTPFAILIQEVESDVALEEGAKMIASAGSFSDDEAVAVLKQLPAAFMVRAPKKQVVAFCGRLSDIGVYAKAYPADATPINWAREAVESLFRDSNRILIAAAVIFALLAGGWFVTAGIWILVPIAIFFGLTWELQSYKKKFRIDAVVALDHASGFEGDRAEVAKFFLKTLRHDGIRKRLTVCLMEYYALSQTLRGHRHAYGPILEGATEDLHALLTTVFGLCRHVSNIERVPDVVTLQQKIQVIDQRRSVADTDALQLERATVADQLVLAQRGAKSLDAIEARLQAMNVTLESLRTRISKFQNDASRVQADAQLMETILTNLDDELDVFAQTYQVVESGH